MKRTYETPMACAEEFMPNEYVAVCWGVACEVNAANSVERHYYRNPVQAGVTHDDAYCGQTSHQWLVDSDNNNVAESMTEINTDGLGNLTCTIYTGADYQTVRDISTVKSGQYIYWTTSSGNRTWHHQGKVSDTVPGHPNRS